MKKFLVVLFLISFAAFSSDDMTISFINYKFDPLENSPKLRNELQPTETEGENYYILQFTGPIYSEWKDKIIEAGGVFHSYVPHFAYVVQMTPDEKNNIEKFSSVRWIGLFQPAYKIHPAVYKKRDKDRTENKLPMIIGKLEDNELKISEERECPCGKDELWVENDPLLHLSVRLFSGTSPEDIARELESWGSDIQQIQKTSNRIILRIPPDSLNALSGLKEVESIEPYLKRVLSSSTWRYSVQEPRSSFTITSDTDIGDLMDTVTSGSTLADKRITGKGEIVTIFDTGLDYWSGLFQDPENNLPGSNHISVQAYTNEGGDLQEVSTNIGNCSHGTHVSSIVAGNPSIADNHPNGSNLMNYYDWGGQTRGNTLDSFPVRLYIQDIAFARNDTCILNIPDMSVSMSKAYTTYNSKIHQNSWNYEGGFGEYCLETIDIDNMVWNNKDFVVVFSAGNFGEQGDTTVSPPSTAKNCISVGASWNPSFDVSPDSIANFSSRGWTTDNRIKPEVVAPGGTTIGSTPYPYRYFLWGAGTNTTWAADSAHNRIRGMIGTSQAAPQVSGACAMIRQYFKDGFYPTGDTSSVNSFEPSAALVKAVVIASTEDMGTGGGQGNPVPNRAEGWGKVVLDNALFFSGESRVLFVSDDEEVSTNDSVVTPVTVVNTSEPLKFVLAWSDTAAATWANPTLVHDLDLTVTAPNNDKYKGNVFSGGYSQTGGSSDRRNNVEVVWLPAPAQTGTYNINVKGYNCNGSIIPFAVAAVGGFEGGGGITDEERNETKKINYLNIGTPFSEKIDIRLNIIKTSNVNLSIYDIAGRETTKLIDEKLAPGAYSIKWGEKSLAGVYFAVLKIDGKKVEEKKIVKIGK